MNILSHIERGNTKIDIILALRKAIDRQIEREDDLGRRLKLRQQWWQVPEYVEAELQAYETREQAADIESLRH
jgi:hypothetical protein